MKVWLASLADGATGAVGTVVIIDVFRAFTTAAVALARGATRVVMVDSLEKALALRQAGVGQLCIGERGGRKPPGFDFGNSPAALAAADVAGKTLIQTTTNGTTGVLAAHRATRIYAGALVSAEATVQAILRERPNHVTLVAMGRVATDRADEDELCALYLRSRLEGRQPDKAALQTLLTTMTPPPSPALLASGDLDPEDRVIATHIDYVDFPVVVRAEGDLLIGTRGA
jgi:2-phosphosulfolactate phosphatase